MCGIIVTSGGKNELDNLQEGHKKTKKRGPDDSSTFSLKDNTFMFNRLSIMGLSRFFVIADVTCKTTENRHDITLDFIILPYTALALAIISVLLLSFVSRIFKNHKMNKPHKEISRKR